MENKIVKKITQVAIISLCCILIVGAVSLPTFAVIDDSGYSNDGFTVSATGIINSTSVFSDWVLRHVNSPSITPILNWYVPEESQAPVYYTFEVPDVSQGSRYYLEFIVPQGYLFEGIFVNHKYSGETITDNVTITEINGVPTFEIYINIGYDVEIVLRRDEETSLPDITFQGYINIAEIPDDPVAPSPDYVLGYDAGYGQGFSDGYIQGSKEGNTSFVELLFKPIQAMHSVVLFDINGTQEGGEITIGGIFGSIVSIMLLVAFLRYFAGG